MKSKWLPQSKKRGWKKPPFFNIHGNKISGTRWYPGTPSEKRGYSWLLDIDFFEIQFENVFYITTSPRLEAVKCGFSWDSPKNTSPYYMDLLSFSLSHPFVSCTILDQLHGGDVIQLFGAFVLFQPLVIWCQMMPKRYLEVQDTGCNWLYVGL